LCNLQNWLFLITKAELFGPIPAIGSTWKWKEVKEFGVHEMPLSAESVSKIARHQQSSQ